MQRAFIHPDPRHIWRWNITVPGLVLGRGLLNRFTVPRSPISGACFWIETCIQKETRGFGYSASLQMLKRKWAKCNLDKPWCRQNPLNHLGSEHPKDSNLLESFYPDQCLCFLWLQMFHDEEREILKRKKLQRISLLHTIQLCTSERRIDWHLLRCTICSTKNNQNLKWWYKTRNFYTIHLCYMCPLCTHMVIICFIVKLLHI